MMSHLMDNFRVLHWEHPVKKRYYRVSLQTDLLGDCVLTKIWGSTGRKNGRIVHIFCDSFAAGKEFIEKIIRIRHSRGYLLMPAYCI